MPDMFSCLWFDGQAEEAFDRAAASRVLRPMFGMKKLDVAALRQAAAG